MSKTNNSVDQVTDFGEALDAGNLIGAPKTVGDADYAVLPHGVHAEDLERFRTAPRRVEQKINFLALDSFCAYVQKWESQDGTEIFADHNSYKFKAILDYHQPASRSKDGVIVPAHGSHIAYYTAKMSDEWKAWTGKMNRGLTQLDFADFLEERQGDITKPDGAAVLECVLDLRASINGSFASKNTLANGSREFAFTETVEQVTRKGIIKLPEVMILEIPIFDRGEPYKFEVRVRFRIEDAKLRFFMKIMDAPAILDKVFFDLLDQIGKQSKHRPLVAEVQ